jgi:hypothetical protein
MPDAHPYGNLCEAARDDLTVFCERGTEKGDAVDVSRCSILRMSLEEDIGSQIPVIRLRPQKNPAGLVLFDESAKKAVAIANSPTTFSLTVP